MSDTYLLSQDKHEFWHLSTFDIHTSHSLTNKEKWRYFTSGESPILANFIRLKLWRIHFIHKNTKRPWLSFGKTWCWFFELIDGSCIESSIVMLLTARRWNFSHSDIFWGIWKDCNKFRKIHLFRSSLRLSFSPSRSTYRSALYRAAQGCEKSNTRYIEISQNKYIQFGKKFECSFP